MAKRLQDGLGKKYAEIATMFKMPYSDVRAYMIGIHKPSAEFLSLVTNHLGCTNEWILNGVGTPPLPSPPIISTDRVFEKIADYITDPNARQRLRACAVCHALFLSTNRNHLICPECLDIHCPRPPDRSTDP